MAHPHELVIVDNKPDLAVRRVLEGFAMHRPVQLAFNSENVGFGPACNQGVALAQYDTFVFTQPDVTILEDITAKVQSLEDNTLYGPRLLSGNTGWNKFGDVIVPYLEGYFIACTRTTWNVIGGFDPGIVPADFEDVDLSYAAAQKGVQLKQLDVQVVHRPGGHWNGNPQRRTITEKNRTFFANKWGLIS
jgi:GT2 family glycosyltransferase